MKGAKNMSSKFVAKYEDVSGNVIVKVFRKSDTTAKHAHTIRVGLKVEEEGDENMIVVGGGGKTNITNIGAPVIPSVPGALLTASHPDTDHNLNAWIVSSKDHLADDLHILSAYAIGLRIKGMTREQLRQCIFIDKYPGPEKQHPIASIGIPNDYILISGGFKVIEGENDVGNLGTASFPKGTVFWEARSKDHGLESKAGLDVWAIGLKEQLPVGRVKGCIHSEESITIENHPYMEAELPAGYALTGGGAIAHWSGPGSLLWNLTPPTEQVGQGDQYFSGASKDHLFPDPSIITTYALGIKIVDEVPSGDTKGPRTGGPLEDSAKGAERVTLEGPSDGKNIVICKTNGLKDTIMYPKNVGDCGNLNIKCLDPNGRVINGTEVTLKAGESICRYTSERGAYSIVFSCDGNDKTKKAKIEFDR